jgi:hypothetical protein
MLWKWLGIYSVVKLIELLPVIVLTMDAFYLNPQPVKLGTTFEPKI